MLDHFCPLQSVLASPGPGWPGAHRRNPRGFKPATLALALATAFSTASPLVLANPQGGVAVHGQISTSTPAPNKLNVITTNGAGTNHSVINWQSFSIPAGSVTNFQQPSAISTSINRVVTNTPSALFGTLSSNGRLVLVNQSGIAVGAGAVIDTAGFTASALRMSDADALAGRLRFGEAGTGSGANITIGGRIIARDGDVVLIAPNIELGGTAFLTAVNGSTVLAAGQQVEITGRGLEGIKMLVQAPTDAVRNLGMLQGDAVGIFAGTLRHSGEIQATTAAIEGGQVVLKATGDAIMDGAAKILAAGGAGAKGGRVDVLGNHVAVMDQAVIDVSGGTGGGTIRVGGDYQGKNAEVPNASVTYFGKEAQLKADALDSGNGGKVIVWADDTTRAYGNISATGGATAGDGGFVEVSGKRFLEFSARADTSAAAGKTGTLLLDPMDVTVGDPSTSGGSFSGSLPVIFSSSNSASSTIAWADIGSNLASSNVEITTSSSAGSAGNITIVSGLSYTSANSVSYYAHNNITVNAGSSISNGGTGAVNLYAGWDGILSSQTVLAGSGSVVLNDQFISGGALNVKAGDSITTSAYLSVSSANLLARGSGAAITLNGGVNTTGAFAAQTVQSTSTMQVTNAVTAGTTMNLNLAGGLTVQSSGSQYAGLQAATSQTIAAKYVEVLAGGTMGASINTTVGNQNISTTGENSTHAGLLVKSTGTSNYATINASGSQTITVTNADYALVTSLTAGGASEVRGSTAQTFTMTGTGLNQLVLGDASGQGNASFSGALQSITAGTGSQAGGITVLGGTINGVQSYITNSSGNQTISTTGDITITAGTASGGSGAAAQIYSGSAATQSISAHNIWLTGGANGSSNGAFIQANNAAASQSITITGGGTLAVTGGSGSGASNIGSVSTGGTSQTITFSAGGALNITGGTNGTSNRANVFAGATGAIQTVTGATSISVAGGANGGATSAGNSARLQTNGSQSITVGSGGITMTGGGGTGLQTDNDAQIFQGGLAGTSQSITVNGGGNIQILGGSSALTNVGSGHGSRAFIEGDGDSQTITFSSGGNLTMTGGTNGSRARATIEALNGSQSITGVTTMTLTGGANGGVAGEGNGARILADAGDQTISANAIVLQGGASGIENLAKIESTLGSQTISVGSGGLTLTGGGGTASSADNAALVWQLGTGAGKTQTINVTGGGSITLQGGSTAKLNVGGSGHGSRALIESDGQTQTITMSGGDISLTGGTNGSRAFAEIYAGTGSANQIISGVGAIVITGGASGGIAGEGNFADIFTDGTNQSITTTGSVTLTGGSGGTENSASINGASQVLNFGGALTLTGSSGDDGSGGARIGGRGGSVTPSNTNLTLTVGGDLTLQAGSTTGTAIGTGGSSTGVTNTITITAAGDVNLNPTGTQNVRIGSPSSDIQAGNISVTSTGGSIIFSDGGGTGVGAIRTLGNVTLTANGAGKTVTQVNDSGLILASQLTVSAHDGIQLDSPNNQVGSLAATNLSAGDISFTNSAGSLLGVTGISQSGLGDVYLTADDMAISGIIAGNNLVSLRPASLSRDVNIETGSTANSLSLSPLELANVHAYVLEIGRLDGTGNVNIRSGLSSSDENVVTLRLFAGGNINSTFGGNIGSVGGEFGSDLTLKANNNVNLTNGNIVLNDGQELLIQADADLSGVGDVNMGGGLFLVNNVDGSGSINVSGENISVTLSGNSAGLVKVMNDGSQSFIAHNNLTFANNNTGSGRLQVETEFGTQTFTATLGTFSVSAGTGTGTSTYVGAGGSGGQVITARGMSITGGASGGAAVGGPSADRNFAQIYSAGAQQVNLGTGGLTLTGGGGALTGNIASLYSVGNQTIAVSGGGDITIQGGSSAGQNVGINNGSMAYITSESDQTITFSGIGSVVSILGGSNGSGNSAGILASNGDQYIEGMESAYNPTIVLTGGSGGTSSEGNAATIVGFGFQEIASANLTLTGGSGAGSNGAVIASPDQLIYVEGNLLMQGGSSTGVGGARIGGLFGASPSETSLEMYVSGSMTLRGGTGNGGVGIGSAPEVANLDNWIYTEVGQYVALQPSATQSVGIGFLGNTLVREGGDIEIIAQNDIEFYSSGGAGFGAIRTTGNVSLTAQNGGKIYGPAGSIVAASTLTAVADDTINLQGNNSVQTLSMRSLTFRDVEFNSNSASLMTVGVVSGGNVSLTAGPGGMEFTDAIDATANLTLTSASGMNQSGGVITVAGLTTVNAGSGYGVYLNNTVSGASVNDFNIVALNGGNVNLDEKNDIVFNTSVVRSLRAEVNGSITLNGSLRATDDSSDEIQLILGGQFTNNAGPNALQTPASNWLVYSQDPANDTKGGLTYDFKQYGAVYGDSILGSGSGFVYATTPAAVTTASMSGSISKTYDTTTAASLTNATFTGVGIDGDLITLGAPTSATYNTADAGTGKNVTVTGLSFVSATNGGAAVYGYTANLGTVVLPVGEITRANLTIGYGAANKVYNRDTLATLTGPTYSGLLGSDSVSVASATGNFVDYNAGFGKTVNVSGISLVAGGVADNYTYNTTATTTANIAPAFVTAINGLAANNKTYDGTTAATLNTSGVTFSGLYGGDSLTLAGSGQFTDKNAGIGKTVNTLALALGGSSGANYVVTGSTLVNGVAFGSATATATIDKANVTMTGITASKEYDGTLTATVPSGSIALVGKVAGDSLLLNTSGLSASFSDATVGTGKTLNVSGVSLSGLDQLNYNLVGGYTGNISRRALSVWTGSANDGLWSSAGNWDVKPISDYVAAVSIPAPGSNVQFTAAAGSVSLQSVDGNSLFTMTGGNLDIKGSLAASSFTQTGGTLSSLGSMTISGTISQTGGTIVSPDFTVSSVGGMALNSQGNQISRLTATNLGGGDIVIKNTALLSLMGMKNTGGNIDLNNIGGVTVLGQVDAKTNIKVTANSPLTVGATGGVTGGGNVALTATNLTSAGNLTLDGPVNGDTVTLDAAGNMDINGTVVGTNGVSAKAGGNLTFGFRSVITGTPTSYSSGGFTSDQRGGSSNGPTSAGSVLTAFLDLFEKALDEQLSGTTSTNPDGSKKRKTTSDTIVTEGEVCRP